MCATGRAATFALPRPVLRPVHANDASAVHLMVRPENEPAVRLYRLRDGYSLVRSAPAPRECCEEARGSQRDFAGDMALTVATVTSPVSAECVQIIPSICFFP
jgi:hypothetical protein